MSVGCVMPAWKNKYCGRWSVWFQSMGAGYDMFHSSSHDTVVEFGFCDVCSMPSEGNNTIPLEEKTISSG
jgi:hypothetical protein